jgi:hypothetical protein
MDVEKCEDDHYVLADFRVLICIARRERFHPVRRGVQRQHATFSTACNFLHS